MCNNLSRKLYCLLTAAAMALSNGMALASDHGDTPLLIDRGRTDARLGDLYAFVRDRNLVMVMTVDPAVPGGVSDYVFPTDVSYRFMVDNNSRVSFRDQNDLALYGGTVVMPGKIREDLTFEVSFDSNNQPRLSVEGLGKEAMGKVRLFAGLRDDPFIVKPRLGKNMAAIVVELPLDLIVAKRRGHHDGDEHRVNPYTLLIWATSDLQGINGSIVEHLGRAFRSTFPENMLMNTMHPRLHASQLGVAPDVMILDLSRPVSYPNGRELADDVVDIIADPRILAIDVPSPTENDVPFLEQFPYLAPPQ